MVKLTFRSIRIREAKRMRGVCKGLSENRSGLVCVFRVFAAHTAAGVSILLLFCLRNTVCASYYINCSFLQSFLLFGI